MFVSSQIEMLHEVLQVFNLHEVGQNDHVCILVVEFLQICKHLQMFYIFASTKHQHRNKQTRLMAVESTT